MTTELNRDGLRQRHDMYLANHYMAAHVTVVSLALGVGGVTAASLIVPSPRFQGNQIMFLAMWLASLLATVVAYAGTMIGAIVLPARLPAVADLLLPLLLGVSEFLLFGVLAYPATGAPLSIQAVLSGWWFALGAFGFLAAASVWRALRVVEGGTYEPALRTALDGYLRGQRRDRTAATATGILGVLVGISHVVYDNMPAVVNLLLASVVVASLCGALISHGAAARRLRTAFADVLDQP